jgi:hypothetical protein
VTLDAVIEKHVLTLDAAFPETDMVNGELPGTVEQLPDLVGQSLAQAPIPIVAPAPASQQALDQTRVGVVERADAQIARSTEVLGSDARSDAVRQTVVADVDNLASQRAEIARENVFQLVLRNAERPLRDLFWSALLRAPHMIAITALGLLVLAFGLWLQSFMNADKPAFLTSPLAVPGLLACGALLVATGLVLIARLYFDAFEFRLFRIQTLQRLYQDGWPAAAFTRANDLIETELIRQGPRAGRATALRELADWQTPSAALVSVATE